jgi:tetrahydromethanopterin S-methyltransferase subunit A
MLGDIDVSKLESIERFERQVEVLRRLGVKEFTDAAGRKVVLDMQHKPSAPVKK